MPEWKHEGGSQSNDTGDLTPKELFQVRLKAISWICVVHGRDVKQDGMSIARSCMERSDPGWSDLYGSRGNRGGSIGEI